MDRWLRRNEKLLCWFAFAFFIFTATYKLTNAPLWFDETIEYWYSKSMIGELPFQNAGRSNMYQRIVSTYQPPLYNVIMYIWLKAGESEWWFRFFGVVMGFAGMIALYKTMCKIKNINLAVLAVVFSACVYQLVYYWQECAEYCLMLGMLFWTIYFWFCLMENPAAKNIICFTVFAVIPVYSQYGAAFPVAAMAFIAFLHVISLKERKSIVMIVASYAIALLGAGLPLYYFFLKKQMHSQSGRYIAWQDVSFSGGIIGDMAYNFAKVFKWGLFSLYSNLVTMVFLAIILIMSVAVVMLSHNKTVKLFVLTNLATWLLYYFSVKLGIYSYGNFGGGRYSLFFIPMWITMIFAVGAEFYMVLSKQTLMRGRIRYHYIGVCICALLCFCYFEWKFGLQDNWEKEDCRGVVNTWYEVGAFESDTIVYYGADSGFAYYVRQNDEYMNSIEDQVIYMPWYSHWSEEEYTEYINSLYGENWPDEFYVAASHTEEDFNTFISSIISAGYTKELVYMKEDAYTFGACLIRLAKTQ